MGGLRHETLPNTWTPHNQKNRLNERNVRLGAQKRFLVRFQAIPGGTMAEFSCLMGQLPVRNPRAGWRGTMWPNQVLRPCWPTISDPRIPNMSLHGGLESISWHLHNKTMQKYHCVWGAWGYIHHELVGEWLGGTASTSSTGLPKVKNRGLGCTHGLPRGEAPIMGTNWGQEGPRGPQRQGQGGE